MTLAQHAGHITHLVLLGEVGDVPGDRAASGLAHDRPRCRGGLGFVAPHPHPRRALTGKARTAARPTPSLAPVITMTGDLDRTVSDEWIESTGDDVMTDN